MHRARRGKGCGTQRAELIGPTIPEEGSAIRSKNCFLPTIRLGYPNGVAFLFGNQKRGIAKQPHQDRDISGLREMVPEKKEI
jgi:hypothetical protein